MTYRMDAYLNVPRLFITLKQKSGSCGLIGKVVMDMELQESVWQQVTK